MVVALTTFAVFAFILGSMFYVYRVRGEERYASFGEYVRKGWPIFSPLNCLLYLFTEKRARKPIMDTTEYPELAPIRDNWETIRDEAVALYESKAFDQTNNPESSAYYDIGFRTFYKYGWSKFYLKWYGTTHRSAQAACPKTLEILKQAPTVKGAMFSVLPVGSKLTRHCDPVAVSLRYHVGLATPNDNACYINIDGTDYSWRDGDDLLFDETYIHTAENQSGQDRIILFCDVERPLNNPLARALSWLVGRTLAAGSASRNRPGEPLGALNHGFKYVYALRIGGKRLKAYNRRLYYTLKYLLLAALLAWIFWP